MGKSWYFRECLHLCTHDCKGGKWFPPPKQPHYRLHVNHNKLCENQWENTLANCFCSIVFFTVCLTKTLLHTPKGHSNDCKQLRLHFMKIASSSFLLSYAYWSCQVIKWFLMSGFCIRTFRAAAYQERPKECSWVNDLDCRLCSEQQSRFGSEETSKGSLMNIGGALKLLAEHY